jgi:uncharacterized protein (TIGR00645 family)
MGPIERVLGAFIFNSRWLAAPFYFGLALALALLLINFFMQFVALAAGIFHSGESEVVLGILGLIDLTFAANLVLIVIFSGYENFVAKIEVGQRARPIWMAKIDFNGMKQKLMTSIVAISAIQVLKGVMTLGQYDNNRMAWLLGIHAVFLLSLLIVVIADRLGEPLEHPSEGAGAKAKR